MQAGGQLAVKIKAYLCPPDTNTFPLCAMLDKTKDTYVAFISFGIFTIVNILGGLVNDYYNYFLGTKNVLDSIPIHLIFCFLFWVSCIPQIKIRKSFRVPIIRTVFWTLIIIDFVTVVIEFEYFNCHFIFSYKLIIPLK